MDSTFALHTAQSIILDRLESFSLEEIQTRIVFMLLPHIGQAYARAYINSLPELSDAQTRNLYRELVCAYVARRRRRAA
jgi:hypothetical protein